MEYHLPQGKSPFVCTECLTDLQGLGVEKEIVLVIWGWSQSCAAEGHVLALVQVLRVVSSGAQCSPNFQRGRRELGWSMVDGPAFLVASGVLWFCSCCPDQTLQDASGTVLGAAKAIWGKALAARGPQPSFIGKQRTTWDPASCSRYVSGVCIYRTLFHIKEIWSDSRAVGTLAVGGIDWNISSHFQCSFYQFWSNFLSSESLWMGLKNQQFFIWKSRILTRNKVCHCFHFFFASICHEVMGLDATTLVFRMLSVKPAFSLSALSSFIFIKRVFSSSSLSTTRVPFKNLQTETII